MFPFLTSEQPPPPALPPLPLPCEKDAPRAPSQLTEVQQRIWEVIKDDQTKGLLPASIIQLATRAKCNQLTVSKTVTRLATDGLIEWTPGVYRTIRIPQPSPLQACYEASQVPVCGHVDASRTVAPCAVSGAAVPMPSLGTFAISDSADSIFILSAGTQHYRPGRMQLFKAANGSYHLSAETLSEPLAVVTAWIKYL